MGVQLVLVKQLWKLWSVVQNCSVQSLRPVQLFATPWTAARQASLSIANSRNLLKLMSIESVMPSNHLILWHPLLHLPSIFLSIRVILNESVLHIRWPENWSFNLNISLSNEHSGLISFMIDEFDLLVVQDTLKSLLQNHSSKASILQLSHHYGSTLTSVHNYWENHSLDYMDLCWQSNVSMLSRFVIAFLPRSKHLLISWLKSPSIVILEPRERNSVTAPTFSPSICHKVMGPVAMISVFWMLSFKPAFHSSLTLIKRLFSSSSFSVIRVVSCAYMSFWYFS